MTIMEAKDILIQAVPGAGYVIEAVSEQARRVVGMFKTSLDASQLEEYLDNLREKDLTFSFSR